MNKAWSGLNKTMQAQIRKQMDIKQFCHKGNKTMVEWCFKNQMKNRTVEAFDGVLLAQFEAFCE